MDLEKTIKEKLKEDKVVIGFKSVIKLLKKGNPQMIVLANNIPEENKNMIIHNIQISNVEIKEYSNDSMNLGLVCGKPFPISVLAIKRSKK
jgi:large subunit ribosomal protein L30e